MAIQDRAHVSPGQAAEATSETWECHHLPVRIPFDHLSHAEAAQRMGIAIKTVEMQVRIALVACRQGLADFESDRPTPTVRPKPGRPRKTAGPPPAPDH